MITTEQLAAWRAAMQAENERLRQALQEIAKLDDVLDYKRGWDAAEIAKAALDVPEEPRP